MNYLVFARKYRPQTFDEVVGQSSVITTLRNAVREERLGHAYLFVGPRGVGKTSVARILAKAVNCPQGKDGLPCNACDTCEGIANGTDIDVIEFDAASNTHLEDIQEKILDSVQYRPIRSSHKIFIVDEVHMISKHAFNALLKTLEEPPSHVKFIFATTEPQKIPDTIISRCQRYDFQAITGADIVARLQQICQKEGVEAADDALRYIARLATGGMRDAQSLLDQAIAFTGGEAIDRAALHDIFGTVETTFLSQLFTALQQKQHAAVFSAVATLQQRGKDLSLFLSHTSGFVRDLLLLSVGADTALLYAEVDAHDSMKPIAAEYSSSQLQLLLTMLSDAESRLRQASSPATLVELTLLRLSEVDQVQPVADLIQRIEALQAGAPLAPRPTNTARVASSGDNPFAYLAKPGGTPPVAQKTPSPAPAAAPTAKKQAVPPVATQEKAAPVATPNATVTDSELQAEPDVWAQVLHTIGESNRRLQGYCNDVSVEGFSGEKLVLGIPDGYQVHRDYLEDFNHRNAILDAVETVTGKRYALVFTGSSQEQTHYTPEPEDPRKNDTRTIKMEDVKRDPLVRDAMNTFGGRIMDIE